MSERFNKVPGELFLKRIIIVDEGETYFTAGEG